MDALVPPISLQTISLGEFSERHFPALGRLLDRNRARCPGLREIFVTYYFPMEGNGISESAKYTALKALQKEVDVLRCTLDIAFAIRQLVL